MFDTLKQLLSKAGQNMDESGNMINDQVALAQKRLKNPDYQPSGDEKENENKFYNSVTGAVAGSVAPVGGSVSEAGPGIIQKFQNLLGKGEMSAQDMLTNAQNITKRAQQLGSQNPVTPDLMQALNQRIVRESDQNALTQNAIQQAKLKALQGITGGGQ